MDFDAATGSGFHGLGCVGGLLCVTLEDGVDAVEDLAGDGGAKKLEVLGVPPDKGDGGAGGLSQTHVALGKIGLVPYLLGQHLAAVGEFLISADVGLNIMPRGELVMRALSGEQGPDAALAPSPEGTAVGALAVTVEVVAQPAGALRQIALENAVDHFERIDDERIAGGANAVTDELEKAGVNDGAGVKLGGLAGCAVGDVNSLLGAVFAGVALSALRRADAHVMALDV